MTNTTNPAMSARVENAHDVLIVEPSPNAFATLIREEKAGGSPLLASLASRTLIDMTEREAIAAYKALGAMLAARGALPVTEAGPEGLTFGAVIPPHPSPNYKGSAAYVATVRDMKGPSSDEGKPVIARVNLGDARQVIADAWARTLDAEGIPYGSPMHKRRMAPVTKAIGLFNF